MVGQGTMEGKFKILSSSRLILVCFPAEGVAIMMKQGLTFIAVPEITQKVKKRKPIANN